MKNIRLEYSPIEGKFNQAQATDTTDVAKGYRTLCCFVNAERAMRFTQAIESKFPAINSGNAEAFPSFSVMKDELHLFMQEDIKLLEDQMNTTYKRRSEILTKQKPN